MQPIFSRNVDIDKMAFVNWRVSKHDDIQNLLIMADGFLLSSIELAKICLENNEDKRADILIFPILTNANHGIELYLKAIVCMLNILSGAGFRIEGGHNIKQIYETAAARIRSYSGHITPQTFKKDTVELKSYIDELFEKTNASNRDNKMDFSRYPFSNDYEDHFYVLENGTVEVDLENFVNRFKIIHDNLENISSYLLNMELHQNW